VKCAIKAENAMKAESAANELEMQREDNRLIKKERELETERLRDEIERAKADSGEIVNKLRDDLANVRDDLRNTKAERDDIVDKLRDEIEKVKFERDRDVLDLKKTLKHQEDESEKGYDRIVAQNRDFNDKNKVLNDKLNDCEQFIDDLKNELRDTQIARNQSERDSKLNADQISDFKDELDKQLNKMGDLQQHKWGLEENNRALSGDLEYFRYQTEMLQKTNKELEENLRVCLTLLKLVRGSVLNPDELNQQHSRYLNSPTEHLSHVESIDY